MPYRTSMTPPAAPSVPVEITHDVVERVTIRPLGEELWRAVLWGVPLGVVLVPAWVGLLGLVR